MVDHGKGLIAYWDEMYLTKPNKSTEDLEAVEGEIAPTDE